MFGLPMASFHLELHICTRLSRLCGKPRLKPTMISNGTARKGGQVCIDIVYIQMWHTDVAPLSAAYRLKGGRGSLAKALIDGTRFQTADAACTALEALLGPVSHFELAGGPNAAAEDNPSERAAEAAAETAGANQGATPAADPTPDPSSSPDPDPAPAPETPHEPAPAPEPEPTGIPPKTMNDIRTIVTETLTLHKNRQRLADLARRLEAAKPAERGNVCTFTDDIPFDLPAAPPAAKPKKPPVPPLPPRYRGDTLMGWSERAMNALMAGGLDYRDAVPIVAKAWPLGGPGPAITVEDDRERALGTG